MHKNSHLALAIFFSLLLFHKAIAANTQNTQQTLSQLENRFFEHQYDTDDDTNRLNRIEQFVFGCNQTGSIDSRLQHILATLPDQTTDQVLNPLASPDTNTADNNNQNDSSDNNEMASNNEEGNNQTTDDNANDNSANYSSYPRVTSLEQELLGHTYENDTLTSRLARLETKAFGSVSKSDDLSQRVDNLDDYAQRHDIYEERKIAHNTNSSLTFIPRKGISSFNNPGTAYTMTNQTNSSPSVRQVYNSQSGSFVGSIEERVAMMEAQEFDHTYPEKPLDKRLTKLEKEVLPNQNNSNLGLFERTTKLWITLHPTDKSNLDNLIASNQTATPQPSTQSNNIATPANSTNYVSTNNSNISNTKRSSWLHKLANQVESATTAPYSGYSNFSGPQAPLTCPYPGSFYVPQTTNYGNSRFIGATVGPGAGPLGIPVGFW